MSNLKEKFKRFDENNPHVWDLFVSYTMQAINAGASKFGAQAVIERIRWHSNIETQSEDRFKISNDHAAFYARKFMEEYPQYDGVFRTRPSKHTV